MWQWLNPSKLVCLIHRLQWETEHQMTADYLLHTLHSTVIGSLFISLAVFKSSLMPHLNQLSSLQICQLCGCGEIIYTVWSSVSSFIKWESKCYPPTGITKVPTRLSNILIVFELNGNFENLFPLSIHQFCISCWLAFIINFLFINFGAIWGSEYNKNSNRRPYDWRVSPEKERNKTRPWRIFLSRLSTGGFVLQDLE